MWNGPKRESPTLQKKLVRKQAALAAATSEADRKKIKKELDEITREILKRNVTVYGAINLRTDGHRIVMAQRLLPRHASAVSGLVMGFAWGVGGLATTGLGALADHLSGSMGEVAGLARAMDTAPLIPLTAALLALALPRSRASTPGKAPAR